MFTRKGDNQDYLEHLWMTNKVRCPGTRYSRLTLTGGLRHPSHMTTPSPSCDSFSKEHLPRVRSSIQINIGEATMLVVLTKDVVEDTLTTNLPVIENAQGAIRETRSLSIGHITPIPILVILKAA
ncbi:hypothetical protein D5086_027111 [Populus alba]|uniref:Uncharacterized protein n=1 Tax=Populus alba TaxID=43335 RepID=A0ACC4B3T5_POPAL